MEELGAEDVADDDDFVVDDDGAGYVHDISTTKGAQKYYVQKEKLLKEQLGVHQYTYPMDANCR